MAEIVRRLSSTSLPQKVPVGFELWYLYPLSDKGSITFFSLLVISVLLAVSTSG